MSAVLYLRHSTRLGSCYREYRGAVEFAYFDDQERAVRTQLEGADVESFTVLTTGVKDQDCEKADLYAKDKKQAFYRDAAIASSNLSGFRDAGDGYARDNMNVYYKGTPVEGADASSLNVLAYGYAKDRSALFFAGARCEQPDDIAAFRLFDEYTAGDRDRVYVIKEGGLTHIRGAKPESFVSVYSSDKMSRLYRDDLTGYLVDICFEDLEKKTGENQPLWYKISGIDTASFRMVGGHYYTADASRVFYKGSEIEGADPASFVVLTRPYAKDKSRVYFGALVVEGAHPASIRTVKLAETYSVSAVDTKSVYYGNEKSAAVPVKYQQLDEFYSKDLSGVFYKKTRIPGADHITFDIISDEAACDARDSSGFYKNGQALGGEEDSESESE